MLIDENGRSIGTVSGGCLEADVLEHAERVLKTNAPTIITYDTTKSDDSIFGLGMGCRGVIRVLLEPAETTGYLNSGANVSSKDGAIFAEGLDDFLHGAGKLKRKFERWCGTISRLPKKQSRVLTHPVVTIFGFVAQPETHIYLKPNVTRRPRIWLRLSIRIKAVVGNLREPSGVCRAYQARIERPETARYD
ncbi:hypothetical protein BH18ACI1_BH18ACI1_09600 [soil metagenome]